MEAINDCHVLLLFQGDHQYSHSVEYFSNGPCLPIPTHNIYCNQYQDVFMFKTGLEDYVDQMRRFPISRSLQIMFYIQILINSYNRDPKRTLHP
jgi:hypothetical protein